MKVLQWIFGRGAEKEIEKKRLIIGEINKLEKKNQELSDDQIKEKTSDFKKRIAKGETLEQLLPESFALVREAAYRVIGERAYDTQLIGAINLHEGKISEMKTGEGKTLAAVFAVYLNALTAKGVHVVTVNDYLSKRDANWMGSIYHFLGLSTACLNSEVAYIYEPKIIDKDEVSVEMENLKIIERKEAYNADVLYGTNNEFGFDYLRDNMAQSLEQMVQRPLNFAIVDEVDSILIDEARTPLIISAPDFESTKLYDQFSQLVPKLKESDDYNVDEKMRSVMLSENGITKVEKLLGIGNIYEVEKISYVHHLEQALKAHVLFKLDRDYVVRDGEIIIVDEFTGRLMAGRRYSEGLHQAIEAKEGVKVQKESRTLASITFQNYFRMYEKLSGMTGTASTSAEEFEKVYKLKVLEIPTNRPIARIDKSDVIYKTEAGKLKALMEEIVDLNKLGRPILVGTISIEKSELISKMLKRRGVEHEVLNAKNHEREALIISKAGKKGAVTIATNMAGRGTDIKLGEGVKEVGGLHIIGTERHEARRIDNQLRGRSGRQGDPGSSQFFVSLEDELMRRFGGDRMKNLMDKLGLPEDEPIENKLISRSIESAQNKIEGFNFDSRKRILEYDDVMNKQREKIYNKRKMILEGKKLSGVFEETAQREVEGLVAAHTAFEDQDQWNTEEIAEDFESLIGEKINQLHQELLDIKLSRELIQGIEKKEKMINILNGKIQTFINEKKSLIGNENFESILRSVYLRTIDNFWMEHIEHMDYMRSSIGFQGYGQRDPLVMYKKEAFTMFQNLNANIDHTFVGTVLKMRIEKQQKKQSPQEQLAQSIFDNLIYQGGDTPDQFEKMLEMIQGEDKNQDLNDKVEIKKQEKIKSTPVRTVQVAKRNDPCPCGSGKKYKKCCGA